MNNPFSQSISDSIMEARKHQLSPVANSIANTVASEFTTRHATGKPAPKSSAIEDNQYPKQIRAVRNNEITDIVVPDAETEALEVEARKAFNKARREAAQKSGKAPENTASGD